MLLHAEHLVCFPSVYASLLRCLLDIWPIFKNRLEVFFLPSICLRFMAYRGQQFLLDTASARIRFTAYSLTLFTVFHGAEIFNFDEIKLVGYFFDGSCTGSYAENIIVKSRVTQIFLLGIVLF